MDGKRSFAIEKSEVSISTESRFISRTPYAAAAKAARRIFEVAPAKKQEVRFVLRETTQGSTGKAFKYIGIKEKLSKPRVVSIAGNDVVYNHKYTVKSCKV